MKWLHGLIVLGVMVSAARGQEGEQGGAGETPKSNSATANEPTMDAKAEAAGSPEEASLATIPPPEWLKDVSWYYIDVPRFRNGERSNDPPETLAWGTHSEQRAAEFGGDLQGVKEKLNYLKELGVTGLILANVLREQKDQQGLTMTIHVDPNVSLSSEGNEPKESANDAQSWSLSAGDQLFFTVVEMARQNGMRIILQFPGFDASDRFTGDGCVKFENMVWNEQRKWFGFGRGRDRANGIDGWLMWRPIDCPNSDAALALRCKLKQLDQEAVLIALDLGGTSVHKELDDFDAVLHTHAADPAIRFFVAGKEQGQSSSVVKRLHAKRMGFLNHERIQLDSVSATLDFRSMCAFTPGGCSLVPAKSPDDGKSVSLLSHLIERWQLFMVLRLCAPEAPVTLFGEEVGMNSRHHEFVPAMWWTDLPNPESKRPTYRGDFYALIQMLNTFRARFAPLRRGDFKPVIADDEKKLLAFARTMPGDEVILVMNYGDTKQSVSLTVGQPGELVPVLSPQLKPMSMPRKGQPAPPEPDLTKIPELRVGAQREFVKPNGTIDFWVDPMGVRIVLVGDSARGGKK